MQARLLVPLQGPRSQFPNVRRVRVRSQLPLSLVRQDDSTGGAVPVLQVGRQSNLAIARGT